MEGAGSLMIQQHKRDLEDFDDELVNAVCLYLKYLPALAILSEEY